MKISAELARAFARGHRSYDTFVGEWWRARSEDASHRRAYRRIAQDMAIFLEGKRRARPRLMVDYACGNGGMLPALARHFPETVLVALDGSQQMLDQALQRLKALKLDVAILPLRSTFAPEGPRIRLARTPLPGPSLPAQIADVVLFLFPNMNYSQWELSRISKRNREETGERDIARFLSRLPDLDNPHEKETPRRIYQDLLYDRALSRNIHGLLKPGGWWFKTEYSVCPREDWTELTRWRMLFSEAALDARIELPARKDLFLHTQDWYRKSDVILDVFEQTLNTADSKGGYVLSAFRARRKP